jgi:hypothetical protein
MSKKEEYAAVPLDVFVLAEQKRRALEGDDEGEDENFMIANDNGDSKVTLPPKTFNVRAFID